MKTGHRWFAAFWDLASRHEGGPQRRARRAVTEGVRGRVLELGLGVCPTGRICRPTSATWGSTRIGT